MISPKLTLKNTFADSLKKLRTDNHLSQQQLADKLFVNRSTIANWELGRRVPDATIIVRIAKIFGVDVSDLLDILLITQFTTVIYYITPDNVYKRGDYYFVLLVPAVMVMIVNLIGLLIKRRSVKREEFFAFLAYILAPTISMIIQLLFYGITVIVLGSSIAALFLMAGILLGREMSSPLLPWLACLPAVTAVFLLRGRFRFVACLVLFLAFGAAVGQTAWHPVLPPEGEYEIRGIVSDEIRRGSYGQVRTCLSEVTLNGRALSSGAYWTFYTDDDSLPEGLEPGREVSFRAFLYHPGGAENPDGYNFREELLRRGVTVGIYGKDGLAVSSPSVFSSMP